MNSQLQGTLRIGTSGIVVPGTKATFPEEFRQRSRLHYYGSLFNTLEINSSFYKIPLASTFEKWTAEVPQYFRFTVKLWRGITHEKKLAYRLEDINKFMQAANFLEAKRGCLLIQFPASIRIEHQPQVEVILAQLHQLNEQGRWQLALELRHLSWYQDKIYEMLKKYNTSLVIHDMPNSSTPLTVPTGQCIYLRFHGPLGDYRGSYTDEFIQQYAHRVNSWLKQGKDVYAYFNNTMGDALTNAQLLDKYCKN